MVEVKPATSGNRTVPANRPMDAVKAEIGGHLSDAWDGALDAADAQFSIWSLKAYRLVMLACLGSAALSALLALGVYGFILIDRTVAIALHDQAMPWLSPLVRGIVYFAVPAITLLVVWHTSIGYGTNEKRKEHNRDAL